ncbi:MAG: rhamnulokinase [Candidatus Lokiarchaeota archaeon]|nr:rhamnulokinase [Candidatus Lokiarchaeota archaeon]
MVRILAFDLGASSGRAIVGTLEKEKLELDEIYRFTNEGIHVNNSFCWDILRIFQKMKKSLSIYVKEYGSILDSIGIDTWGVDFVLLDENDDLIQPAHHYRDHRTDGMLEKLFKIVPKEEIFNQTGIQFMQINTIVQIFSMIYNKSPRLSKAKTLLMLPDYFNFLLSGKKYSESSEASTSQLYNPIKKDWSYDLIRKLNLDQEIFPEIIQPGTILGNIQEHIAAEMGLNPETKITIPPTHDTGSAVAAVPVNMDKYNPREWAYLSSGTWSLLGVELNRPLINDKVLKYNFTNEGGINHTTRFLKNISGLWLIQECKKLWDMKETNLTWERIDQEAMNAQSFQNFFNPDDQVFLNPPNMINAIQRQCELHNQSRPESIGQISRCVFENLAFKYKHVMEQLEDVIGTKIKILHIIGGGSQNHFLNQFTANVLNIPVRAGPSEATAIGNILTQALALGEIKDMKNLRRVVRNSFQITEYTPKNKSKWKDAYNTYLTNI